MLLYLVFLLLCVTAASCQASMLMRSVMSLHWKPSCNWIANGTDYANWYANVIAPSCFPVFSCNRFSLIVCMKNTTGGDSLGCASVHRMG